jgi:lysozyme
MQGRKSGNAQGIDVSHWNGVTDWSKVAASGISFAFIKATQNSVDKMFLENVKGAKAAGLLIGAYHYLDNSVTTAEAAKAAAKMFHNAIQSAGVEFDLPPVLDYESKSSGLSVSGATVVAKAFLE